MLQPSTTAVQRPRTALHEGLFLGVVFAAVFFAPYLIRPSPTISRSYVAGFSNHAAFLLFLAGTVLFAVFTRGEFSASDGCDSLLSRRALGFGLAATLLACVAKCRIPMRIPGGESLYFLTRQQWVVAGRSLYHQLEFGYGPLLLYPSLWVQRALHTSSLLGYILAWIMESLLGAAMLWVVVRDLDLMVRSRVLLFAFLLASQLVWVDYGGVNYTCFRNFAAAFAITLSFGAWRRTWNPWWLAGCTIASVLFCLACSVEQAVGAAFGLNLAMLLLVADRRRRFPVTALLLSLAGTLACFVAAERGAMLHTFRTFGTGGYAYPLLPSPSIFLALFGYVAAGCALYRVLRQRQVESVVVPLACGGLAMLPAALGRADILHIASSGPLFLVGVAAIFSMPRVRRWWLPLAWVFLILVPLFLMRTNKLSEMVSAALPAARLPAKYLQAFFERSENQTYFSAISIPASSLPCDRTYFSPSFMPMPFEPFRPSCLDTGYFDQFTNVATPQTIAQKLAELEQHSSQPLLLESGSLQSQIPPQLDTMTSLRSESGSLWVPPVRNPPLTYLPLIEYIRAHYVPGPLTAQGRLQIWNPRANASK